MIERDEEDCKMKMKGKQLNTLNELLLSILN